MVVVVVLLLLFLALGRCSNSGETSTNSAGVVNEDTTLPFDKLTSLVRIS